jgi:hypothetical protein
VIWFRVEQEFLWARRVLIGRAISSFPSSRVRSRFTLTSSAERVAFRQINKKTGNRLRQQLIDEETGDPIDADDKGRGYEVEKGVYLRVVVDPYRLDRVSIVAVQG